MKTHFGIPFIKKIVYTNAIDRPSLPTRGGKPKANHLFNQHLAFISHGLFPVDGTKTALIQ
ncbi:hypothetical protein ADIS_3478 [Lunatimonas lonarensis]|uniref:Uncharacterized protein n=1 Tax=Lunatimonas lonarensis TaxID=1232681 RepID=R7ZQG0_9BACT|nr:hypothetical protein ADIS_3478 [Lunatimonas lonarensis]